MTGRMVLTEDDLDVLEGVGENLEQAAVCLQSGDAEAAGYDLRTAAHSLREWTDEKRGDA